MPSKNDCRIGVAALLDAGLHARHSPLTTRLQDLIEMLLLAARGFVAIGVGRIKRSADPAPNHDSMPSKNDCRIGVAALLDAGLHAHHSPLDVYLPVCS